MSRYRHLTPIGEHPKIGCKVWGHYTEEYGYYCLRCWMPLDLWPTYTNGGIFQRVYHRLCWPLERWWVHERSPAQRWPYVTHCEDCGKVDRVWTWTVGDHKNCVVIPF
jgi:hypothetical protein